MVQENAAAFWVELSSEEKAYLEEVFAPGKVRQHPISCMVQHISLWHLDDV
jgi:hypothetical protein